LSFKTLSNLVTNSLQFSWDVFENWIDSGCIAASGSGAATRPAREKAGNQSAVFERSNRILLGQLSLWTLAQIWTKIWLNSNFKFKKKTYVVLICKCPYKGCWAKRVISPGLCTGVYIPDGQLVRRLFVFGENKMWWTSGETPANQKPRLHVQTLQKTAEQDRVGQRVSIAELQNFLQFPKIHYGA